MAAPTRGLQASTEHIVSRMPVRGLRSSEIPDAEAHVWRADGEQAGSGGFVEADLVASDLSRRRIELVESSADLHDVRDFLGHANITTTSRYLRSSPVRLAQALERMEASAGEPDDADERHQLETVR